MITCDYMISSYSSMFRLSIAVAVQRARVTRCRGLARGTTTWGVSANGKIHGKMMWKSWENDGKWWEHGGKMMWKSWENDGKWWEHGGKMMWKSWEKMENDGNMVEKWCEMKWRKNDVKMVEKWWENDGKMTWWKNDVKWWENNVKMVEWWKMKWCEHAGKMMGKWWKMMWTWWKKIDDMFDWGKWCEKWWETCLKPNMSCRCSVAAVTDIVDMNLQVKPLRRMVAED